MRAEGSEQQHDRGGGHPSAAARGTSTRRVVGVDGSDSAVDRVLEGVTRDVIVVADESQRSGRSS